MPTFELSLSSDYVPDWTIVDAVREFFQNALDQQTTMEGNTMFCEYKEDAAEVSDARFEVALINVPGKLFIGNKLSVLSTSTLLLGSSSKRDDPNTIGQFGEGYKVGTLVLLRNGKKLTFHNYGAREVWTPRFKKSKKYDAEILEFNVDKKFPWQTVPNNNLVIEIDGITLDEYATIVESNLHLQGKLNTLQTSKGRILLDTQHKGKVYVNGLFVCNYEPYTKGYDFKPEFLKLGRDRSLVDQFTLRWLSSQMWADDNNDEVVKMTAEMVRTGAKDVEFLSHFGYTKATKKVSDSVINSFKEQHGDKAVPVSTQDELVAVPRGHKAIMVTESEKELIKRNPTYVEPTPVFVPGVRSELREWLDIHRQSLSKKAIADLEKLIERVKG